MCSDDDDVLLDDSFSGWTGCVTGVMTGVATGVVTVSFGLSSSSLLLFVNVWTAV